MMTTSTPSRITLHTEFYARMSRLMTDEGTLMDARLLDDLVERGGGVLADCILNIQHADTQGIFQKDSCPDIVHTPPASDKTAPLSVEPKHNP